VGYEAGDAQVQHLVTDGDAEAPLRLAAVAKRPKGRFWIGKSDAGSLADSTQLRSAVS
jgi:hypothetical protein